MDFENTILQHFLKPFVDVHVGPILSNFCQTIKNHVHLKFWSAKFGSVFYQLFKLLYLSNRKRSESEILAASSTHGSLRHITNWEKSKTLMVPIATTQGFSQVQLLLMNLGKDLCLLKRSQFLSICRLYLIQFLCEIYGHSQKCCIYIMLIFLGPTS